MKISCVIPAYNEAKNIELVISKVKPLVDELIVIDDCSTDNTFELASQAGVTVLRHIINRGQGAALQTGNDYALAHGTDIIVHFDADDQFSAAEIKDVVRPILDNKADAVWFSFFRQC